MRIDSSLSPHFLKSVEDNVKASVCPVSEIGFFDLHAFSIIGDIVVLSVCMPLCPLFILLLNHCTKFVERLSYNVGYARAGLTLTLAIVAICY